MTLIQIRGASLAAMFGVVGLSTPGALARGFAFDFNADGVLPSAQGATYVGAAAEASVSSVSGGLLTMNLSTNSLFPAYYKDDNAFNHAADASIEWRMRLITDSGPDFGPGITISSPEGSWTFVVYGSLAHPNGGEFDHYWGHGTWGRVATLNPFEFHTYKATIAAQSSSCDLYVDGAYVGTTGTGDAVPSNMVAWGDGFTDSYNLSLSEWDYVTFDNAPAPGGVIVMGMGGGIVLRRATRVSRA